MDSTIQTADKRLLHVTQSKEEMIAYERYFKAECDRVSSISYATRKGHKEVLELLEQGLTR